MLKNLLAKVVTFFHAAPEVVPVVSVVPVAVPAPKRGRGRPPGVKNGTGARKRKATKRRACQKPRRKTVGVSDMQPKRPRGRPRKAAGGRKAKAAPVAAPAEPEPVAAPGEPGTALVPISKGQLVPFRAKPITAEQFWRAAEDAKASVREAFGERWDLAPGESGRVLVPSRYRSFRTALNTRIRITGDRRYPAPKYWPGGELPPLCLWMGDYAHELTRDAVRVPSDRWLTYDGPELELVPEVFEPEEDWRDVAD